MSTSDDVADILALLAIIKSLDELSHTNLALDTLYDEFDTQLLAGNFAYCDSMLARVAVEDFSPTLHVGFLTISVMAKEQLTERADYYNRVATHFETLFDSERCVRLLQGLG